MSAAAVVAAVRAGLEHRRQGQEFNDRCALERSRAATISPGTAFYRKHTEALLRRYMRTSWDMGRSPSLLGNLIFRGKASHSSTRNLEDAVIFVHDVETCLNKLDRASQEVVARIALQEYTQDDVAVMSGRSARSIMRLYAQALDQLTEILLEVDLLEIA